MAFASDSLTGERAFKPTRTNRRLILLALKDKIASSGILANPLKIGQLMDAFSSNVATTFSIRELRRFYEIMKLVPSTGAAALIPTAGLDNFTQIQQYLTTLNETTTP
jgi:hypothetical protein